VRRGIEVIEFACGVSHLAKGETLPQLAEEKEKKGKEGKLKQKKKRPNTKVIIKNKRNKDLE